MRDVFCSVPSSSMYVMFNNCASKISVSTDSTAFSRQSKSNTKPLPTFEQWGFHCRYDVGETVACCWFWRVAPTWIHIHGWSTGPSQIDTITMPRKGKFPQWRPEGDDAALVARSILEGKVNQTDSSFKEWTTKNDTIASKYGYPGDKNGSRNFRSNFLKLYDKINRWKQGEHGKFDLTWMLSMQLLQYSLFCVVQVLVSVHHSSVVQTFLHVLTQSKIWTIIKGITLTVSYLEVTISLKTLSKKSVTAKDKRKLTLLLTVQLRKVTATVNYLS